MKPDGTMVPGFSTLPGQIDVKSTVLTFSMAGFNEFAKHVKLVDDVPTLDRASMEVAVQEYLAAIALFRSCVQNGVVFTPAKHTYDGDVGPGGLANGYWEACDLIEDAARSMGIPFFLWMSTTQAGVPV